MTNQDLRSCPTCRRDWDEETEKKAGLRSGKILNQMCPGKNGPSDIDHVLHNKWSSPERVTFIEYKSDRRLIVPTGQRYLHDSLRGHWVDVDDPDRKLDINVEVIPSHPADPEFLLRPIVEYMWRPRSVYGSRK